MPEQLIERWKEFLEEYSYDDDLSALISETIEALGNPDERLVDLEERFHVVDKAYTDLLAGMVEIPKALAFLKKYSFKDHREVYTNGTDLVPMFRVEQALNDKAYNGLYETD